MSRVLFTSVVKGGDTEQRCDGSEGGAFVCLGVSCVGTASAKALSGTPFVHKGQCRVRFGQWVEK